MVSKGPVITIDGPAGAGKSTVAQALAARLGFRYLDTGAMYRALTWLALEGGVALGDESGLVQLARDLEFDLQATDQGLRVIVGGRDLSEQIRSPVVDQAVSYVARVAAVRQELLELQRKMPRAGGLVAEGRDMATVVFPNAHLKLYLEASLQARARRRWADSSRWGGTSDLSQVEWEIAERDRLDSTRTASPLAKTAGHITIETDELTPEEVVEKIESLARNLSS